MKKSILSPEVIKDIISMYNSGVKVCDITRKYKISDLRFYGILKEYKVPSRVKKIPNEVMSKIDVDKLEDLYNSGMTQNELAKEFNVVRSTISKFMTLHNIPVRKKPKKVKA
jgi:DNA invertase Pin-like site-specific DNA recombinase